jgi:PAS domain S-box-containing protein
MIRILVVDDLKELLDVIKFILESNPGFKVDTATSVKEALSYLKDHEYDIIISDYYMPEENGLDFLKKVRSMNCSIPFIMQTGQGDEFTAIEALQNGADFFLEKGKEGPLEYLAFTQIINVLVSKQRIEDGLKKSENTYKALFERNGEGIVHTDNNGVVLEVNGSFLDITGCLEHEVRNKPFHQIVPVEWNDIVNIIIKKAFPNGRSEEYRRDYIRRDGSRLPVSVRSLAIRNQKGEPEGAWIVIHDLSRT